MDIQLRIKKLEEIEAIEKPYMTGIRINYKGHIQEFNAYRIPLEYLIYNKYNGRIGSVVKSFEKQYRSLNPEIEEDKERIRKYLYNSKAGRNEMTKKSLLANGQQQYGIVTNDGVIIDGNRRASLLNTIYKEYKGNLEYNVDHCGYFIAIILPEPASAKEVIKLETTYQMGADEKLDYNPIEKYIKCKDLKEQGYTEVEISKMMNESKNTIDEWLEIMELMDDYLSYLEYDGIYTRLDKREGQFVDLNAYLKTYNKRTAKVEWAIADSDISDLKTVCFDYIRAKYEGKEFRSIAKPSKKDAIFCDEDIWKNFLEQHDSQIGSLEEQSVQQFYEDNANADLSQVLEARDEQWTKNVRGLLQGNLNQSVRKLDNKKEANQPSELLKRAKSALESINPDALDQNNMNLVKELNQLTYQFKKIIEKK